MPPGQTLEKGDRVYIVEGIFHAIALFLKGYKAIACLSSGNIPVHVFEEHKGKGIVWTVALDRDTLKKDKPRRFVEKLRELEEKAEVCIPPDARDWDDRSRDHRMERTRQTRQGYGLRRHLPRNGHQRGHLGLRFPPELISP